MNVHRIKSGLQELRRSFAHILDDTAEWIIADAIKQVDSTKKLFEEQQRQTHHPGLAPEPWGYRIFPETPLRFKPNTVRGLELWVDVFCTVLWVQEGDLPVEQNLHLRVWSSNENDCTYRQEWDSDDILDKLTGNAPPIEEGRVMLRYHFDLAEPHQQGPQYHLQLGGNLRENELCWFPESIKLPRLPFPPMDLVLLCELIAANFYWDDYLKFYETPEWQDALRRSQNFLLHRYYQGCFNAVQNEQGLLVQHLWNSADTDR
jgi:hypothetical protein